MPIYEYRCNACNWVFRFMVPTMTYEGPPECPRCGCTETMERQLSRFSFVRGGTDPLAAIPTEEDEAVLRADQGEPDPEVDEEIYFVRKTGVVQSGEGSGGDTDLEQED